MPVTRLEARVYVHATESREKVLQALLNLFPEDVRGDLVIEEERYEGHYGNPIIVITARIEGEKARRALESILSRMRTTDVRYLEGSLEERVDKSGVMYFRVSKQDAYLGEVSVYEADDVIRVSVHFQGGRRRAIKEYREILKGDRDVRGSQGEASGG